MTLICLLKNLGVFTSNFLSISKLIGYSVKHLHSANNNSKLKNKVYKNKIISGPNDLIRLKDVLSSKK